MSDMNRLHMIQLFSGTAFASIAGCLGSDDNDDDDPDTGDNGDNGDDYDRDENGDNGNNGDSDENDGLESGDDAPKTDVKTPDGETITVEPKGKPTVVMFVDITTEKGKSYSETLVELHGKYDDYAHMLTINSNLDVSKEDLQEFKENYGGDWDHAMGTEDAIEKYGVEASVLICVIDEDGKVVFRADGDIDYDTVETALGQYSDY